MAQPQAHNPHSSFGLPPPQQPPAAYGSAVKVESSTDVDAVDPKEEKRRCTISEADGPLLKEGYLIKLGYSSGRWQKRYFYVRGNYVSYSRKPNGPPVGGFILKPQTTIAVSEKGAVVSKGGKGSGLVSMKRVLKPKDLKAQSEYTFCLAGVWKPGVPPREFYMDAENENELAEWIAALESAISLANEENVAKLEGQIKKQLQTHKNNKKGFSKKFKKSMKPLKPLAKPFGSALMSNVPGAEAVGSAAQAGKAAGDAGKQVGNAGKGVSKAAKAAH